MFKHRFVPEIIELQSRVTTRTTKSGRVYVIDGVDYEFPSITTVLGRQPKDALFAWQKRVGIEEANRISRQAAVKGTKVHNFIEDMIFNRAVDFNTMMPNVRMNMKGAEKVLNDNLDEVWASECKLFSKYLGVAGRVDLVGLWCGVPSIVDFKTSLRHKTIADIENYLIQETAYAIMFEEITTISIPQLVTLMMVEGDQNPLIFVEKRRNWEELTLNTIQKYR